MKKAVRYKNYICVVFAFLMIIIGICLCETQADSSFALRTCENVVLTWDRNDSTLQVMLNDEKNGYYGSGSLRYYNWALNQDPTPIELNLSSLEGK